MYSDMKEGREEGREEGRKEGCNMEGASLCIAMC
jgi:hypothetical protein